MLSFVEIQEGGRGRNSTIIFEFPTPILEAVKNPEMYVILNLLIMRGLQGKYSSALYELLQDYKKLGKLHIEVKVLRKILGVAAGQYKVFTMFKKRILDISVSEINEKTDLKVTYSLERQGRKVVAVHFQMR